MSASVAEDAAPAGVGSTSRPSAASPTTRRLGALSAAELRTGMQQHFRTNGTLQQLTTQLRGIMLTELLQQPKTAQLLVAGTAQSVPPAPEPHGKLEDHPSAAASAPSAGQLTNPRMPKRGDPALQSWSCALADALVENHLRRTRRAMSLSIFSTEAEVPPFSTSGAPSEEEQYLAHLFRQTGDVEGGAEDSFLTPAPLSRSVLQRLVEDSITKQNPNDLEAAPRHLHSCSTQTDAADNEDGAANPLNSLECRLAAVDAKYALTFSQLKRCGATGEQPFFLRSEVERRLAQYKQDMHAQLRSEYEQKYNTFTRVQLQEARDAAEEHYRVFCRNKAEEMAEMERSVTVKLEQERERLKLAWEDVHQQRTELERRQRDTLTQVADQEAAQQRVEMELHKTKEACRMLQLQCSKWEELCATRLMELDGARSRENRRVEDIRRLQAEHAAELQLKEEEVGRLRYRLRLVTREMEPGACTMPAGSGDAAVGAASAAAAAPLDSRQLYGLLLRTEEMQRNAAVQQQQQQQRWDAAWVAASAGSAPSSQQEQARAEHYSGAPASALGRGREVVDSVAPPERGMNAGQQQDSGSRAPAAPIAKTPQSAQASAMPSPSVSTSAASKSAASAPRAPVAEAAVVSAGSLPSMTASTPGAGTNPPPAATESPAAASSSPASSAPRTPQKQRQQLSKSPSSSPSAASSASKPSTTGKSSSSSPSSIAASTPAAAAARASTHSTSTSTSLSATPSPSRSPAAGGARGSNKTPATPPLSNEALQAAEKDEEVGRAALVTEEENTRAGIVWSESNSRAIVLESVKQSQDRRGRGGSSDEEDVAAPARPWERFGAGQAEQLAPSGGATLFDDSFSTDDDALLNKSDDDDSDF